MHLKEKICALLRVKLQNWSIFPDYTLAVELYELNHCDRNVNNKLKMQKLELILMNTILTFSRLQIKSVDTVKNHLKYLQWKRFQKDC